MSSYTMQDMVQAAEIMEQHMIPAEFKPGMQYECMFESFYISGPANRGEKPEGMPDGVFDAFKSALFWKEGEEVKWALVRR